MRIFLFALLWFPLTLFAQTFYISPQGNDLARGTRTDPLASLQGARDRIRDMRRQGIFQDTVVVVVEDGTYRMAEPLMLGPEDSGTDRFPVIYRAAAGTHPLITGEEKITGFTVDARGYWVAQVPVTRNGQRRFEQLFVSGRRAERAFSPDSGFYHMRSVSEQVWVEGQGRAPQWAQQIVGADAASLKELATLTPDEMREVVMTVYHKWDITKRHPDGISDTAIYTSGERMKPWNRWHAGTRYRLENYAGALTRPGEWFLDDGGCLTYISRPGEDPSTAEVWAPRLTHLIIMRGNLQEEKYVSNIRFEGLRFAGTADYLPAGGFEPSQAAAVIDAAVQMDGVRNITFVNCEISRTGNYGIWFRKDCRVGRIEHCYIHDLGAGGVRIGTMKVPEDTSRVTRKIVLENNIIQSGGYVYPPAVGVWIGQSSDNRVSHNDIGDFRYTGVSVGWIWGYAYSPAKRNRIVFNHIHHIGWGLLSDMGGVYTLGRSEGTVVSNNVIDHIWAYDYGGWGLYPDEGSSHIVMENNLVYKTKTGGFHQHYGEGNIIRNNIIANAAVYQLQCTRVEDHLSFTFENNIVWYDRGVLMGGPWDRIRIKMDHNLFWDNRGEVLFLDMPFKKWQKKTGHDRHSLIADPGFKAPGNGDFTIENLKLLKRTGFVPFDYSKAGVYGSEGWKEKAILPEKVRSTFDKLME